MAESSLPPSRWALRIVGALALLVTVAGAGLAGLLVGVGQPWMKEHVRGLVSDATGLDVDYRSLVLHFPHEVALQGLVVRSPAQVRAHAPELLQARTVRARLVWTRGQPALQALAADGVRLAVVTDERGQSSLDFVGTPSDEPASPLSRQLEVLLASLPAERVRLSEVTLELVHVERGQVVERDRLEHLALEATLAPRGAQGAQLRAQVRVAEGAAALVLRRALHGAEQTAELSGTLRLDATERRAAVALALQLRRQSFSADVPAGLHIELAASAGFDPERARTSVQLSRLAVGQGVATAQALVEFPDAGPPTVRSTQAEVDVPRLLALLPAWLVPVEVERGQLSVRTPEQPLTAMPSVVHVRGALAGLRVPLAQGALSLDDVELDVLGRPRAEGMSLEGRLELSRAALEGAAALEAEELALAFHTAWGADRALTGRAELRFGALRASGPEALEVRGGALRLETTAFAVAREASLALRGELALEGSCQSLEQRGSLRWRADAVGVSARLPRSEGEALQARARITAARLHASSPDGVWLDAAGPSLELALREVALDPQQLAQARGRAHGTLALGALRAALDVEAQGGVLDYRLTASLARLSELRALAARARALSLDDALGVELASKGRLAGLAGRAPELSHDSELRLARLALAEYGARRALLRVQSRGSALRHAGEGTLEVEALTVGGVGRGDAALAMSATLDAPASTLELRLRATQLASASLRAKLVLAPGDVVQYEAEGDAAGLAPLSPLLPPGLGALDLAALQLAFRSAGSLSGVLASDAAPGELLDRLGGRGRAELTARQVRWADGDLVVHIPAARLQTQFAREGDLRTVDTELDVPAATARSGATHVELEGLHDHSVARLRGAVVRTGTLEVAQDMTVRSIDQDLAPGFPVGEVSWKVRGSRDADGVLKVRELELHNGKGGSSLKASGGIDMSGEQSRLSLRAHLEQDLRPVAAQRALEARGRVGVDLSLASPNLRVFHTTSVLRLHDAHVTFTSPAVALEGIDGEIPVVVDFTLSRRGARLLRGVPVNPYAALRYADQHPMLAARSFVSIRRVSTPFGVVAPFAANLGVQQNVVSLSQMELGVRGGTVTGSSVLDWDGASSRLELNLRASEVRSSHGEPFDGNAALLVDFAAHSVRGRADILRIGRRHLLDILDIQDPSHTDPAIERIRTGLRFGYPERVRISFKHGFVNAGVSLGGFARFMRIDDVKGIPVGPLMERAMSSMRVAEAP